MYAIVYDRARSNVVRVLDPEVYIGTETDPETGMILGCHLTISRHKSWHTLKAIHELRQRQGDNLRCDLYDDGGVRVFRGKFLGAPAPIDDFSVTYRFFFVIMLNVKPPLQTFRWERFGSFSNHDVIIVTAHDVDEAREVAKAGDRTAFLAEFVDNNEPTVEDEPRTIYSYFS